MILLRKFLILSIFLLTGSLFSNGVKKDNWKEFTSLENGFSVQFPKLPDHIHQKVDIPKSDLELEYDTYVSEPNESSVFVVSVWDYPPEIDMSKPEVNLKDGFSGMITALPGSKVLDSKIEEFQGYKALDFLVKSDDLYFQGKLLLVYNTLYQVFAVYKEKEKKNVNYERFIKSFKLLDPEKKKIKAGGSSQKVNV